MTAESLRFSCGARGEFLRKPFENLVYVGVLWFPPNAYVFILVPKIAPWRPFCQLLPAVATQGQFSLPTAGGNLIFTDRWAEICGSHRSLGGRLGPFTDRWAGMGGPHRPLGVAGVWACAGKRGARTDFPGTGLGFQGETNDTTRLLTPKGSADIGKYGI